MTDAALSVAREQLRRMRGMTALYHRRFFSDIWFTTVTYLAVLTAGHLGAEPMFATLAFVALFGAVVTAFDASYLIFARHYATRLESYINRRLDEEILVGGRLEESYLFPLNTRKIVTISAGSGFSWFGFMTAFFTILGAAGYALGVALALQTLESGVTIFLYMTALGLLTLMALAAGIWWFVAGTGEARLDAVLGEVFGEPGPRVASR